MERFRRYFSRAVRTLALLTVVGYLILGPLAEPDDSQTFLPIATTQGDSIEIRPRRISPGGAILVDLRHAIRKADREHIRVHLGEAILRPVSSGGKTLFFGIPDAIKEGPVVAEVWNRHKRLAAFSLDVRSVSAKRLARNGLGGVSLILFGIWLLSRSFGKLGLTLVHSSARWLAASNWRCLFAGLSAGVVVQTPRAAARFFGDILSLRLVPVASGLLMVAGAFLGSWLIGALLPLFSISDGLLLVPAGGLALVVAKSGRDRWIALAIIGMGLMLYGLHLLRSGLGELYVPLFLAEAVARLHAATIGGLAMSFVVGIVVGAVLQGPGAVFAIIAGLVQSTGFLSHDAALAVLAGAVIGSSLMAVWSSEVLGPRAVRSAMLVTIVLSLIAIVQVAMCSLIALVLDPQASRSLAEWAPGRKVLFPGAHAPLVVDFTLSLLASTLFVTLIGWAVWQAIGPRRRQVMIERMHGRVTQAELGRQLGLDLSAALRRSHDLLQGLEDRILGDSVRPPQSLRQELDELEAVITEFLPGQRPTTTTMIPELHGVGLVLSQLHATLEQALGYAEQLRENRAGELVGAELRELVTAVRTSLRDLGEALSSGTEIDLDRAQQVEIAINRGEAALRQALCSARATHRASGPSLGLLSSFAGTLESVGNEAYRLAVVLDRSGLPAGLHE